ncbi:hypothetical protein [Comamonas sp. HJ-2]
MSQSTSPDNVPSAIQGTADSMAAPGRVGAGGTNSLEQFQRWLQAEILKSAAVVKATDPRLSFAQDVYLEQALFTVECNAALKLLMQFKLEQGE